MHKYWGKKPANDLKKLIEQFSNEGDTILDPFAGYGVFCCEAYLLNRNVISNDLNPIATFINSQLISKDVNLQKLEKEWELIKKEFIPFVNEWYAINVNDQSVQLISILRNKTDKPIKGRYKLSGTSKIKEITFSKEQIESFINYEINYEIIDWYPQNDLIENSRISAKRAMKVTDLFTKRTLACHARLLSLIENLSTGNEKNLFKLAFTANLANCSKLVPPIKSRGDMSQGAWMTGFYVGDTYIENNVVHYFENRLEKIIKGKKDFLTFIAKNVFQKPIGNDYIVTQYDAKKLDIPAGFVDYVFTDPPYGDAVPYFEQSVIWNSWLKLTPNYQQEIVISDSKFRNKSIENYEKDIDQAFSEIRRVLKPAGFFSLTYHSLSGLEWKAITNACIKNGFEMVCFDWLVQKTFTPRQLNRAKSIKGDVLVTFQKADFIQALVLSDFDVEVYFKEQLKNWLSEGPLETNEIFLRVMKNILQRKILVGEIDLLSILIFNFKFDNNNRWILNDQPRLQSAG